MKAALLSLALLGCSGCITVRCPEPPKSQDGKPLPPQNESATKVIQTGQQEGRR